MPYIIGAILLAIGVVLCIIHLKRISEYGADSVFIGAAVACFIIGAIIIVIYGFMTVFYGFINLP